MKTQITIKCPSCLGFSIKKKGWKIGGYSVWAGIGGMVGCLRYIWDIDIPFSWLVQYNFS